MGTVHEKITIRNSSDLSLVDATNLVVSVIEMGKVSGGMSGTGGYDCYSWLNFFVHPSDKNREIRVSCHKNSGESFTFSVENELRGS